MIQFAGHGVAMGNACDALKDAADEVTLTNNEDGIAHTLNHYWAAVNDSPLQHLFLQVRALYVYDSSIIYFIFNTNIQFLIWYLDSFLIKSNLNLFI